jgi:two-component system NtrC family sensor kinase
MRLATKLTLALVLVEILLSVASAWTRLQWESASYEDDMRRDHHLLGRGLGAAVVAMWRKDGEGPATQLVGAANEVESQMTIRAVYLDASDPEKAPAAPAEALVPLSRGDEVVWVDPTGEGTLYTYHPIGVASDHRLTLEIAESLAAEDAWVEDSIYRGVVRTILFFVLSAAVTTVVGALIVGRPAARLAEQTRRIGAGDLSTRLPEGSADELGELARQLNAMTDQLLAANRRITEETSARVTALEQLRHADRLRTVGQLASGLAHELGTPLNVVQGRAQMIASGEALGDEIAESARIIEGQAERMTQIIRQLLDFARARPSEKVTDDVAAVAERAVRLLTAFARKQGTSLSFAGDGAIAVRMDAGQIHQALANLLVNAAQARASRVDVRVSRVNLTEPPRGGRTGTFARIEVRDDGTGIGPDLLPRLFEPFFTTKGVGEGTGLGLAVAWGIVAEHGGFITVDSAPGHGTTFALYLPEESA